MSQESRRVILMPKRATQVQAPATYSIGDDVFWATASAAGEWTFVGHPRGDNAGKVLVLASSPEIGFEIDADQCSPAGWLE